MLLKPICWAARSRIPQETRKAESRVQKALLDTAMLTIDTMDNAIVFGAKYPVDTLYPGRDTIIQVSDSASALRHFKSKYSKPPSHFFKKYASFLIQVEEKLLMAHELYELQAQLAGVPLEDLATLHRVSRWCARAAKIHCLELKRTCKAKKLPPQLTQKLLQALGKFYTAYIAKKRAKEALMSGARQYLFQK